MSGRYALVIGNSEYEDTRLARLSAPGKDAQDLASVLGAKDMCAFDDVRVLVNEREPVIREAIDEFFDCKSPEDLVLLYFSGHGVRDEQGVLYLAVRNTNRSRLRSTAIQSNFIHEAMEQSRAKRQVLILDCCNSGAFEQGTKAATGGSVGTKQAFAGGYGRIILTASDSLQYAWQGDAVMGDTDNSLFTHFLVEGLKGAAEADSDGSITVDALYDYTYEQVRRATPNQTPSKFSSKQEGEIILRQLKAAEIKPAALPDTLVARMEDIASGTRFGAVRDLASLLNSKNLGLARAAREALERMSTEDDSRAVQRAAQDALEPVHRAEQKAESERVAAVQKAEADKVAAEKAEAGRLAAQRAERERIAAEKADEQRRAAVKAEMEQLAAQKAAAHRLAAEKAKAEAERPAPQAAVVDASAQEALPVRRALPRSIPAPRNKMALVYGGGAVVVLAVIVVAVLALNNALHKTGAAATPTTAAAAPAAMAGTGTAEAQAKATLSARGTATKAAQAARFAALNMTNTAIYAARTASSVNTAQAASIYLQDTLAQGIKAYGPADWELKHNSADSSMVTRGAGVSLSDFIAQATFYNPYTTSVGSWDYGFLFRGQGWNDQYRLFVVSSKQWVLENWQGSSEISKVVASGSLPNLDTGMSGSNRLALLAQGSKGLFFVNGQLVATLDLSARSNKGEVAAGTGFYSNDEITGYSTNYSSFTVWKLP